MVAGHAGDPIVVEKIEIIAFCADSFLQMGSGHIMRFMSLFDALKSPRRGLPRYQPRHSVQNIDTPEDWTRAEWLFKALQAQTDSPLQA